ncbi:GNAT domain-containing protein [Xylaria arbuscula]|nr:GNAT domain-containing protein [Xylaria arbuscula]
MDYTPIRVLTTLPSLDSIPFPAVSPHDSFSYRPLLTEDLDAYTSFLQKPLESYGECNPDFDLDTIDDPIHRLLQNHFAQGIHLTFFLDTRDGVEIIGEGGVYILPEGWPSMYWIHESRAVRPGERNWKREIPQCIHDFWWSIPRQDAQLLVDAASLVTDSQDKSQPNELLCAYGIHKDDKLLPYNFFEYKEFEWRSWGNIPVLTTLPDLHDRIHLITPSCRLMYRTLTYNDLEAFYSVRQQHNPMVALGAPGPDTDINTSISWLMQYHTTGNHDFPLLIGIFLKHIEYDGIEGDMIGYLGVRLYQSGFPELHYILKEEYQGKGYGSEFLSSFVRYWASLPRKQVYLHIDPMTMDFPTDINQVVELLQAETSRENQPSQGILRNNGFHRIDNKDSTWIFWYVSMDEVYY